MRRVDLAHRKKALPGRVPGQTPGQILGQKLGILTLIPFHNRILACACAPRHNYACVVRKLPHGESTLLYRIAQNFLGAYIILWNSL